MPAFGFCFLRFPRFWNKTELKVTQLSEKVADYRLTQWTLGKIQSIRQKKGETLHSFQKRRRTDLGFGIAEGFVLYKFSLPIWASAYLCVTLFYFF
jgi:hypothetical protein